MTAKTDKQRQALQVYERHDKDGAAAARELGISRSSLRGLLLRGGLHAKEPEFEISDIPDDGLDVFQTVEIRKRQYAKKKAHEEAIKLIPCKINLDGPIGIHFFGDPHVDDDGTDLTAIEHDCRLIRDTEGLFGANVGDTTNNWIGRLARLYGEQETSGSTAWKIAEWFLRMCPKDDSEWNDPIFTWWLFWVGGNHDAFSGPGDPLIWMARQQNALYMKSSVRLNLMFPNGRQVRVNCAHNFKGMSQWNPAHGSMKSAQKGFHDHLLINGHRHVSGYGIIKDPATGTLSHCVQVASYKVYDRYAKEMGLRDQHISPSATAIINPDARDERSLITVYHDPDEASQYLTWKRTRS